MKKHVIEINEDEKEHLIAAIKSANLNDKGYLWNLLKTLEKK